MGSAADQSGYPFTVEALQARVAELEARLAETLKALSWALDVLETTLARLDTLDEAARSSLVTDGAGIVRPRKLAAALGEPLSDEHMRIRVEGLVKARAALTTHPADE